jgi:hypothetical protein
MGCKEVDTGLRIPLGHNQLAPLRPWSSGYGDTTGAVVRDSYQTT